jgi:phosphatidylinositol-3-phosphatase
VAAQIAAFRDRDRGNEAAAAVMPDSGNETEGKDAAAAGAAGAAGAAAAVGTAEAADGASGLLKYFPSPRAAAVAVLCMVGLGVIIGSATSQVAQSAGLQTIVLDIAEPKPPPAEEPVEVAEAPPEEAVAEAPAPEAPPEVALPPEVPEAPPAEPEPTPPPEEPVIPPELEPEETLPPVKHLWVIMLGENGYEETFGTTSQAPYLKETLPEQGELLPNYYAVAQGKLSNQVALLSGQGPTPELVAECPAPTPTDIVPGTIRAETATTTKQVEGNGCVFPAPVETLAGQLAAKKLKWKTYVEEAVPGTPEPPSCARPFALFHSLLDKPECLESTAGLPQLAKDLKALKTTPAFSYIVPNRCHAGAVEPCEPGQPAGPVAAEPFLKEVVPPIVASKAYSEGGLILITSSQAPQTGAAPDASSCCATPAYPNLPPLPEEVPGEGGVKKTGGGGKVGLLMLSSFVKPGTKEETTIANHFTLLSTIEELLEIEDKLGYANEPALLPLEPSVFNAFNESEGESTSATEEEESSVAKRSAVKPRLRLGWGLGSALTR